MTGSGSALRLTSLRKTLGLAALLLTLAAGPAAAALAVKITAPGAGETVSGSAVVVTAEVSNNVGGAGTHFYIDDIILAEDESSPYSITFNSKGYNLANGAHILRVVAYNAGSQTEASISVNIDNPIVGPVITGPTNQEVTPPDTATFSVSVSGSGPFLYQWYKNGAKITSTGATRSYYETPATTTADDKAEFYVVVTDFNNDRTTSGKATLTVNSPPAGSSPPTVSITAPSDGASVSGVLDIVADARDDQQVARVEFYLYNELNPGQKHLYAVKRSAPYTVRFDTTLNRSIGRDVSILAKVYDDVGNSAEGSIVVHVNNAEYVQPDTKGEQKIAVLVVRFSDIDDDTREITPDTMKGYYVGKLNEFIKENSFGQTWVSADVYGWYTLDAAETCDQLTIAGMAENAATEAGVQLANYNHIFYIARADPSSTDCRNVGAYGREYIYERSVDPQDKKVRTITHEFGHLLNLLHSNALNCGDSIYDPSGTCKNEEYGNPFSVMGESRAAFHFPALDKEHLGWMSVVEVTSDGTYSLAPLESQGPGTKGLKIESEAGNKLYTYYLEYRRPTGFDSAIPPSATEGLIVTLDLDSKLSGYTANAWKNSYLLDMNPGTSSREDAPLSIGETYTDPGRGFTITPVSRSDDSLEVKISGLGGFTFKPVITSGESVSCVQNAACSYQIKATNSPTSYGATNLPTGLNVNTSNGLISGTATEAGSKSVLLSASNAGGFGTTGLLTLTVDFPAGALGIKTAPQDAEAAEGGDATFTVEVEGVSGSYTYQWYDDWDEAITGATAASYTRSGVSLDDDGAEFYVIVTDANGIWVQSDPAVLTVTEALAAPAISVQPGAKTVTAGQSAAFSVTASGNPAPSYQWQKKAPGANAFADIASNATSASYTTPATVSGDSGAQFRVVVSNTQGNVTSNGATLTVNSGTAALGIKTAPQDAEAAEGGDATFTVEAEGGSGSYTYQWYDDWDEAIAGATAASYTRSGVSLDDDWAGFYVIVTDAQGASVQSDPAVLTVSASTSGPCGDGVCDAFEQANPGVCPLDCGWAAADAANPTAAITAPSGGATVSGYVEVAGTASDNVGVSKIELYADTTKLATLTASPWSHSWDTSGLTGSHTLKAKAYDAAGNVGTSAAVTVTVAQRQTQTARLSVDFAKDLGAFNPYLFGITPDIEGYGLTAEGGFKWTMVMAPPPLLAGADSGNPANYDFKQFDADLSAVLKGGLEAQVVFPIEKKPSDLGAYASFVKNVARHMNEGWGDGHRRGVKLLRLGNEPDNAGFWQGTQDDYFQTYGAWAKALRAVSTGYILTGPAIMMQDAEHTAVEITSGSWARKFLEYASQNGVPLDIFTFHVYSPFSYYQFHEKARLLRAELDKYPLLSRHYGAPLMGNDEWNMILGDAWRGDKYQNSFDTAWAAASNMVSLIDMAEQGLALSVRHGGTMNGGDLGCHDFPLTDCSRGGKPSFYAFQAFNRLAGSSRVEASGSDHVNVAVLAGKKDKEAVVVANYDTRSYLERYQEKTVLTPEGTIADPVWEGFEKYVSQKGEPAVYGSFKLELGNLPAALAGGGATVEHYLVDDDHKLSLVESKTLAGGTLALEGSMAAPSVHLFAIRADAVKPSAAITAPAGNASVPAYVHVLADASDDIGVAKVELWVDGALKETSTTKPYSFFWNATQAPGAHTLTAKAYDAAGNVGTSASVQVTVTRAAAAPSGEDSPFGFIQGSFTQDYKYDPSNREILALGVHWDRPFEGFTRMAWPIVETTTTGKGNYDFSESDRVLAEAFKSDVNLFLSLPPYNCLYGGDCSDGSGMPDLATDPYPSDPDGVSAFKAHAVAVVRRYAPRVKYWMVGQNEFDDLNPLAKGFQAYNDYGIGKMAEITKAGCEAVKEACPECRPVLGGAVSPLESFSTMGDALPASGDGGSQTFASQDGVYVKLLSKLGDSCSDMIIDYHLWPTTENDQYKMQRTIIEKIRKLRPQAEIWTTESGNAEGPSFASESDQARDVVRIHAYALASGQKKVFWTNTLEYCNYGGDANSSFNFMGLINNPCNDGVSYRKLSYYTYKKMVELLEGSDWSTIETVQEIDGVYAYKFTKGGKPVWVAWNDSGAPAQIALSSIPLNSLLITEAVPQAATGRDVKDYATAFGVRKLAASNGSAAVSLSSGSPVFIEPFADASAPEAAITAPAQKAGVSGLVRVTVEAWDDLGVTKVELYVDGMLTDTLRAEPYTFQWDAAAVSTGAHYLSARAYDAAGLAADSARVKVAISARTVAVTPGGSKTVVVDAEARHAAVNLSTGTFAFPVTVTVAVAERFPEDVVSGLMPTGVGVRITVAEKLQPSRYVAIEATYQDSDIAGLEPTKLVLARYDEASGSWLPLRSTVDRAARKVIGWTDHFSLFQVMGTAKAAPPSGELGEIRIYPNPFYPNRGQGKVTLDGLPAGSRVRIYTLPGELVWEGTADAGGVAQWPGVNRAGLKAASDVYRARVDSGGRSRLKKLSVIR